MIVDYHEPRQLGSLDIEVGPFVLGNSGVDGNFRRDHPQDERLATKRVYLDALGRHPDGPTGRVIPPAVDTASMYGAGDGEQNAIDDAEELGYLDELVIHDKFLWKPDPEDCMPGVRNDYYEPDEWPTVRDGSRTIRICSSRSAMEELIDERVSLLRSKATKPRSIIGAGHDFHKLERFLADTTLVETDSGSRQMRELCFTDGPPDMTAWELMTGELLPALFDAKAAGKIDGVSLGQMDWRLAEILFGHFPDELDGLMLSNTIDIMNHDPAALGFIRQLGDRGKYVFLAAPFRAGFIFGTEATDKVDAVRPATTWELAWRARLQQVCRKYGFPVAAVALQFLFSVVGMTAIAPGMGSPRHVTANLPTESDGQAKQVPRELYRDLMIKGGPCNIAVIREDYPYKDRLID